ncbi:MAG: outer membrane protein assembly factor BamB [Gammaproteobacteria bacterium]|nr:outer membrane protein assembly factor BamB [Gammaproteobacteria bacterium]
MRAHIVLLTALLLAACGSKGKVKEPAPLQPVADPRLSTRIVWDADAGEATRGYHAELRLAVEPDAVFGADVEGDVYALNPDTGERIWETATGARVVAGPGVAFNLVLVGTLDGEVLALRRADGALAWKTRLSSEVLATPVSDGNVVVARTVDGKLFGLSADTGARVWAFDRSVPPLTLRGLSTPLLAGDLVVSGLDNGRIVAVRVADGQPVWEEAIAVPTGRSELERITDIDADLLVGDGLLYAASFGGELAAIGLDDGEVRWRRSIKSYTGFAMVGSVLVVSDENSVLWGLEAQTGAQLWKQEGLLNRYVSKPAETQGYAVVTDREGYLHWLAPQDGRIVARERIAGGGRGNPRNEPRPRGVSPGFATPPVAREGRLYVMTAAGRISAIDVAPRS